MDKNNPETISPDRYVNFALATSHNENVNLSVIARNIRLWGPFLRVMHRNIRKIRFGSRRLYCYP